MNDNPLNLLLLALATWRLAYLIANEKGPFDLITRFRARFSLGGLTTCIYCLSIWCAALCYGLLQTPLAPLVYMLAAAGGAMLMHRYTGGNMVE